MIIISFGKWNTAAGRWYIRERIYVGYKWTPFCKIRRRSKLEIKEVEAQWKHVSGLLHLKKNIHRKI